MSGYTYQDKRYPVQSQNITSAVPIEVDVESLFIVCDNTGVVTINLPDANEYNGVSFTVKSLSTGNVIVKSSNVSQTVDLLPYIEIAGGYRQSSRFMALDGNYYAV
jgi:hypothetical protein